MSSAAASVWAISMAAASLTSSASSMASSASIFTRSSSPTMASASGVIMACMRLWPPAAAMASRRSVAQWCSMTRMAAAPPAGMAAPSSWRRSTDRPASRSATISAPSSAPARPPCRPPSWRPMRAPAMEPRRIRSASERSVRCIVFSMLPWASFWTKRMSMTRMRPRFRTRRSSAMMRPVASNLSKPMTKTWMGPVTCLSLIFVLLSVVGGCWDQRPAPWSSPQAPRGVGSRAWTLPQCSGIRRPRSWQEGWSRTLRGPSSPD